MLLLLKRGYQSFGELNKNWLVHASWKVGLGAPHRHGWHAIHSDEDDLNASKKTQGDDKVMGMDRQNSAGRIYVSCSNSGIYTVACICVCSCMICDLLYECCFSPFQCMT